MEVDIKIFAFFIQDEILARHQHRQNECVAEAAFSHLKCPVANRCIILEMPSKSLSDNFHPSKADLG